MRTAKELFKFNPDAKYSRPKWLEWLSIGMAIAGLAAGIAAIGVATLGAAPLVGSGLAVASLVFGVGALGVQLGSMESFTLRKVPQFNPFARLNSSRKIEENGKEQPLRISRDANKKEQARPHLSYAPAMGTSPRRAASVARSQPSAPAKESALSRGR